MRSMILLCLVLAACAKSPSELVTPIAITIEAEEGANPDGNGRPSPIVVRIYQLAETDALEGAQFFQAYDDDQALLGASLLWRRELTVAPGTRMELHAYRVPEARALAVVAAFRDVRNAEWSATAPVEAEPEDPSREMSYLVKVSPQSVSLDVLDISEEGGWFSEWW